MSSPNNTSTSSRENAAAGADEKPRLTEEEKKQNHIASEQKRRQAIREGFDRLTELVPGLEGQGRSEGLVLKRTVEYMRQQMQERRALIERIEQSGGHVDDELKKLGVERTDSWPLKGMNPAYACDDGISQT
ncbi:Protein max [Metarhizium anisopliae]|nr:Protein max [Metarhizium anisopliae]